MASLSYNYFARKKHKLIDNIIKHFNITAQMDGYTQLYHRLPQARMLVVTDGYFLDYHVLYEGKEYLFREVPG